MASVEAVLEGINRLMRLEEEEKAKCRKE
jgi:hypothetical protein